MPVAVMVEPVVQLAVRGCSCHRASIAPSNAGVKLHDFGTTLSEDCVLEIQSVFFPHDPFGKSTRGKHETASLSREAVG